MGNWFIKFDIILKGNANRCSRALVKDTKKGNYIVIIALKIV